MRTASIAAGVAVLLAARGVVAQAPVAKLFEGDVTLDYRRGPGTAACPDEAALRERAADSFDFRDPFVARGQPASAHMRIAIERAGAAYQGKVLLLDDAGATLTASTEEHADCDALVWLLGHRVALAILRRPPATAALPAPSSDPAPAAVRIPVPLPAPTPACDARCAAQIASAVGVRPAPPREPTLSFAAGGLLTAGWTADVGPGAWLAASAREGALSLGLELRSAFPAPALTYAPNHTASATSVSAVAVPCAHWKLVAGCVFAEIGAHFFLVPGSDMPLISEALVALGPRLALDVPLGAGLSARAFADLAVHPYLPIFSVRVTSASDTDVRRWTTPPISGLFGLGVAWSR
jgi:hypothetical protein